MIPSGARRQAYLMMSSFRPSRKSPLTSFVPPLPPGSAPRSPWPTPGYGTDTDLRDGITEAGLPHGVGIQSSTSLWPSGLEPLPLKPWRGRGRPTSAIRRNAGHQPISAKQLALDLPKKAWRRVT